MPDLCVCACVRRGASEKPSVHGRDVDSRQVVLIGTLQKTASITSFFVFLEGRKSRLHRSLRLFYVPHHAIDSFFRVNLASDIDRRGHVSKSQRAPPTVWIASIGCDSTPLEITSRRSGKLPGYHV